MLSTPTLPRPPPSPTTAQLVSGTGYFSPTALPTGLLPTSCQLRAWESVTIYFFFSVTLEIGDQGNLSFSFCLTTASYHCSHSAAQVEDKAFPPRWLNRNQAFQAACLAILSSALLAVQIRAVLLPRPHVPQCGAGSSTCSQLSQLLTTYFQTVARFVPAAGCRGTRGGFSPGAAAEPSAGAATRRAIVPGLTYNWGARAPSSMAPLQSSSCCSSHRDGDFVFRFQMTRWSELDTHTCPNPSCPTATYGPSMYPPPPMEGEDKRSGLYFL